MDRAFENFKEWYREIAVFTGGRTGVDGRLEWIQNPYDSWYGGVFGISPDLDDDEFERRISHAANQMIEKQIPEKLMICEQGAMLSEEKLCVLSDCGFHEGMWQTGMEISLTDPQMLCEKELREGDRILLAEKTAECAAWADVAEEAFAAPEHREILNCFIQDPNLKLYAYLNGDKMAATSMVYQKGNEVGIYLVGTAERFRRRGYADALVRHLLLAAADFGAVRGVLQASEMGKPVYERIGFQSTSRISHWEFHPK